jgi:NADH-quinone oxidoreductase subunit F
MTVVSRVLPAEPYRTLAAYQQAGGGAGLDAARAVEPAVVVAEVDASGLRGRGGAGFPTGRKWTTVVANRSAAIPTTVVVNGAEGEPGTFKDRTILTRNPYAVLEGALIAAHAVGADRVIVAVKAGAVSVERLRAACREVAAAGWQAGVDIEVFEGPDAYLYGEETALLEALDGRAPLPRLAPPYRRGVDEVLEPGADIDSYSGLSAEVELAGPSSEATAPPALVDNVETLANVPGIIANGAAWFRSVGTEASPGTIVCTISGTTVEAGVAEIALGTTLREAIEEIGGGLPRGRRVGAVLAGVSNALLPASALDTPLTYEAMAEAGGGLGSAGYVVVAEDEDLASVVAGASRFLAVESCGQCTPCKQDGRVMSELLARLAASAADEHDLDELRSRVDTVTDGARCSLATQHQAIVTSFLAGWPDAVAVHLDGRAEGVGPTLVAELVDITDGVANLDLRQADKQPDWTHDEIDSGKAPADRLAGHPAGG